MIALKTLKMKKVKNLLTSKEEMEKVRISLEKKTAKAFADFVKNRVPLPDIIFDKCAPASG